MNFLSLIGTEFKKIQRAKIVPILILSAIILWFPSLLNVDMNFQTGVGISPENNLFIQGLLGLSWFLYPASMIVCTLLLNQIERGNNGIQKMLTLPISTAKISLAKFVVLMTLGVLQLVMVGIVYYVIAYVLTQTQNYDFLLSPIFVLKELSLLYITSIPMLTVFWMISVLIKSPFFSIGLSLASIVPSVLFMNTDVWYAYPMSYSFYFMTAEYGEIAANISTRSTDPIPFVPVAIGISLACLFIANLLYGKAERK